MKIDPAIWNLLTGMTKESSRIVTSRDNDQEAIRLLGLDRSKNIKTKTQGTATNEAADLLGLMGGASTTTPESETEATLKLLGLSREPKQSDLSGSPAMPAQTNVTEPVREPSPIPPK